MGFPEPILSGSVYIRTLLDGSVQDGAMVHSTLIGSYASKRYVGVKTRAPYNMVEVIISPAGASDIGASPGDLYLRPGAGRMALDIYEVCSD